MPLFILLMIVYFIPLLSIVKNSFTSFSGSNIGEFSGFENFGYIEKEIPRTIFITLIWTIGSVVPAIVIGLILAALFQSDFSIKRLLISLNLLPYSIPLIIVASCWLFLINQDFGLLNVFLMRIGVIEKPILFLNIDNALLTVILARIWRAMPFAFINFYSAMKTIPVEWYEAADVDGASSFQKYFFITLPNLKTIILTALIVLTVWTFLVFDIIYGMTGGGPIDATRIISIQIYREMFHMKDLGTASAWSLIAVIILLLLTIIYWKIFKQED
jgi:multiple sugar transport system permease protein